MKEADLGAAVRAEQGGKCGSYRSAYVSNGTDPVPLCPTPRPSHAVALMEGMAFARSAFGGELAKPDYRHVASAVFCQPPLATGGWHDSDALRRTVQQQQQQQPCQGAVAPCSTATYACMQPATRLGSASDVTLPLFQSTASHPNCVVSSIHRTSPCAVCPAVGYTEEQAVKEFSGNIDVYVSRFRCAGQVWARACAVSLPWAPGPGPGPGGSPGAREGGRALHGGASALETERCGRLRHLRERDANVRATWATAHISQPALAQPHCNQPTRARCPPPPSPRPMKYTISGREEKTLMKLIVHAETDLVLGCHMWVPGRGRGREWGRGDGRGNAALLVVKQAFVPQH